MLCFFRNTKKRIIRTAFALLLTALMIAGSALADTQPVDTDSNETFLPVCCRLDTDEKIVALTIDDCNQADNLRSIIDIINKSDGRATIFPIGSNVEFLGDILRDAVDKGFEIENHTYSHAGLYEQTDEELASEIWQQNAAVSKALGTDYRMHFLRPRGGDNRYDQRTHAYMRQMGYYGMAYWSQVGSGSSANAIMDNLEPGQIILFHTTDEDLSIISELVPKLRKKGYRMVTLNEMYGLGDNTGDGQRDWDTVMPLAEFERVPQTLHKGEYLHDVMLMQEKLSEMGYLTCAYNGYFGDATEQALKKFQNANGLDTDGICGSETWNALFDGSNAG